MNVEDIKSPDDFGAYLQLEWDKFSGTLLEFSESIRGIARKSDNPRAKKYTSQWYAGRDFSEPGLKEVQKGK